MSCETKTNTFYTTKTQFFSENGMYNLQKFWVPYEFESWNFIRANDAPGNPVTDRCIIFDCITIYKLQIQELILEHFNDGFGGVSAETKHAWSYP